MENVKTDNKSLHLTAIPLRFIAAGELGRYDYSDPQPDCTVYNADTLGAVQWQRIVRSNALPPSGKQNW